MRFYAGRNIIEPIRLSRRAEPPAGEVLDAGAAGDDGAVPARPVTTNSTMPSWHPRRCRHAAPHAGDQRPEIDARGYDLIDRASRSIPATGATLVQWADERYRGGPLNPSATRTWRRSSACARGRDRRAPAGPPARGGRRHRHARRRRGDRRAHDLRGIRDRIADPRRNGQAAKGRMARQKAPDGGSDGRSTCRHDAGSRRLGFAAFASAAKAQPAPYPQKVVTPGHAFEPGRREATCSCAR